jgi:ubiquinone/menaquinone biosynthesis C-methylase UbiE
MSIKKSPQKTRVFAKTETKNKPIQPMKTDWGGVAGWYDKMISDTDSYQNQVILPNVLKILQLQKNQSILDMGCGVGYFCQKYFEIGAKVVGVDLGIDSIKIAKSKTSPKIQYYTQNIEQLQIAENEFDFITIILTIQNVQNPKLCFQNCQKLLKKNGKLIIVINHPYFRIPKNSSWVWSPKEDLQYRRVDRYLTQFKSEIDMNPGNKNSQNKTVSFHRPLSFYINELNNSGFVMTEMQEWISHRKSDQGPHKTDKLEFCRKEFPLFMALVLTKV